MNGKPTKIEELTSYGVDIGKDVFHLVGFEASNVPLMDGAVLLSLINR